MSISMLTESVELVLVVWLASIVFLIVIITIGLRRTSWKSITDFLADEEGASYALPYVMTLPFLLLIFCFALQGTLILLVKYGTVHAAYASARAAVVWQGADPEDKKNTELVDFYADRAAIVAMIPFASGVQNQFERATLHFRPSKAGADVLAKAKLVYVPMYRRMAELSESGSTTGMIKDPDRVAADDYVYRKVRFAAAVTTAHVRDSKEVAEFNSDVEVKVTYAMPLHIPLAAPLFSSGLFNDWLGRRKSYAKHISTTVSLPSEASQTSHGRLEVPYFPEKI